MSAKSTSTARKRLTSAPRSRSSKQGRSRDHLWEWINEELLHGWTRILLSTLLSWQMWNGARTSVSVTSKVCSCVSAQCQDIPEDQMQHVQQSPGAAVRSLPVQPLLPPTLFRKLRRERGRVPDVHPGEPQGHGHAAGAGPETWPAWPLQQTGRKGQAWLDTVNLDKNNKSYVVIIQVRSLMLIFL